MPRFNPGSSLSKFYILRSNSILRFLTIAVYVGIAHTLFAQPAVDYLTTRSFNAGVISDKTPVENTFIVKNEGPSVLIINDLRTACGCTTATISDTQIKPMGTAELYMRFDPAGRSGMQSVDAELSTNDPAWPVLFYTIQGIVKPQALSIEPKKISVNLAHGETGIRAISVISPNNILATTATSTQPRRIQIAKTSIPENNRNRANFVLHVSALGQPGSFSEKINIQILTAESTTTVSVPVLGREEDRIIMSPNAIFYSASHLISKKVVRIKGLSAAERKSLKIKEFPPGTKVQLSLDNSDAVLTSELAEEKSISKGRFWIKITIGDQKNPLEIPVIVN